MALRGWNTIISSEVIPRWGREGGGVINELSPTFYIYLNNER